MHFTGVRRATALGKSMPLFCRNEAALHARTCNAPWHADGLLAASACRRPWQGQVLHTQLERGTCIAGASQVFIASCKAFRRCIVGTRGVQAVQESCTHFFQGSIGKSRLQTLLRLPGCSIRGLREHVFLCGVQGDLGAACDLSVFLARTGHKQKT